MGQAGTWVPIWGKLGWLPPVAVAAAKAQAACDGPGWLLARVGRYCVAPQYRLAEPGEHCTGAAPSQVNPLLTGDGAWPWASALSYPASKAPGSHRIGEGGGVCVFVAPHPGFSSKQYGQLTYWKDGMQRHIEV